MRISHNRRRITFVIQLVPFLLRRRNGERSRKRKNYRVLPLDSISTARVDAPLLSSRRERLPSRSEDRNRELFSPTYTRFGDLYMDKKPRITNSRLDQFYLIWISFIKSTFISVKAMVLEQSHDHITVGGFQNTKRPS